MSKYKVIIIKEGGIGTLLLGASKLPLRKVESQLNKYARDGWELSFMVIESHRFLLFWQREAAVITLRRDVFND